MQLTFRKLEYVIEIQQVNESDHFFLFSLRKMKNVWKFGKNDEENRYKIVNFKARIDMTK